MPSPFPGMDPWLEDAEVFGDVHASLIYLLRETLNGLMPPGYKAGTGTRVWVDDTQKREPDVSLYRRDRDVREPAGGGLAVLTGLTEVGFLTQPDPWEQPYLEVRTDKGRRLVTCIEIVSRSNKTTGKGRELYQSKQEECRLGGVNLVEIDLLRGGPHTTCVPRGRLERKAGPFDYHVSVVRAGEPPTAFGAAIRLADRLPAVGIPLDPDVPPVTVDLQALFDRCYDGGRYPEAVDYKQPPDPPLTPEQQAWADDILRSKGLKP